MHKPNLVCHADWSSTSNKRWCAKAVLGSEGKYTAHAPKRVGDPGSLLDTLRDEAGRDGCVFVGFDFPIGVPLHYAKRAEVTRFRDFLLRLCEDEWSEFFNVCDSPEEISVYRPFYPNRSDIGARMEHLFDGHWVASLEPLLRQCERGGNGQRRACSLFWTLGGNQVGKAALCGWKDVLIPAANGASPVRLWPFDGPLDSLLTPGLTVVAETYPAECYGWFPGKPLRSKSDIDSRSEFGLSLLSWAVANEVSIENTLAEQIRNGFCVGKDDAFDAVVGLFGMLQVCLGQRASGEPKDIASRDIEGWILGRTSGSTHATNAQTTSQLQMISSRS